MRHNYSRRTGIWLLLGYVVFFFFMNCSVFPVLAIFFGIAPEILSAPIFASIAAQMAHHSIWCTLAPFRCEVRFLTGVVALIVLYGGFAISVSLAVFRGRAGFGDVGLALLSTFLLLPLLLLAAQTPLWIMRIWFRWRIVHQDEDPSVAPQSLRIGGLMIATAVIAIALAAVRFSQSLNQPLGDPDIILAAIAASLTMTATAVFVLPAVIATLRVRRWLVAAGLVLFLDLALVLGSMVLLARLPGTYFDRIDLLRVSATTIVTFVAIAAPMLFARKLGYRLHWGRDIVGGDRESGQPAGCVDFNSGS